jgi:hypothetical protein
MSLKGHVHRTGEYIGSQSWHGIINLWDKEQQEVYAGRENKFPNP